MERVICLAIGYVFGLFQTAFIYGKMNHIDIREHGSGNAGTTNALRVLGKKAGLIVFLGDVFKCFFAVELVRLLFKNRYPDILPLLSLYAAAGAILGHNFPFYLQFKGGKGISCFAGVMVLYCWQISVIAFSTFIIVFLITKIVSISSMLASLMLIVSYFILGIKDIPLLVMISLMFVLIVYKHRSNIMRLIKGEENKIDFSKKEK